MDWKNADTCIYIYIYLEAVMHPFLAMCYMEFPACPFVCFAISAISNLRDTHQFLLAGKPWHTTSKKAFLLLSKLLLIKNTNTLYMKI